MERQCDGVRVPFTNCTDSPGLTDYTISRKCGPNREKLKHSPIHFSKKIIFALPSMGLNFSLLGL